MLWRQKMLKEFKDFAMRGNVFDMAIGIIIGAAFGAIVTSFVDDLLMPPIGMLLGGVDFTNLFFSLDEQYASLAEAQLAGAATINYGLFLSTVIDFLIVAFVIFLLVRQINRLKAEPEEVSAEPTTKDCLYCATEIPIQATRCPHCTSEI
jgi:large conductance mechanosensitive channel